MVKTSLFSFVLLCILSCSEQPSPKTDQAFDTQKFELNSYSNRVNTFLRRCNETRNLGDYQAIFVHTKDCSNCMRSAFDQLQPFLAKTMVETIVFINDSSFITSPPNSKIKFVCMPLKQYTSAGIFHSQIYLYKLRNGKISATVLHADAIDSLNHIPLPHFKK